MDEYHILLMERCQAVLDRDYRRVRQLDRELARLVEREREALDLVQQLWPGARVLVEPADGGCGSLL